MSGEGDKGGGGLEKMMNSELGGRERKKIRGKTYSVFAAARVRNLNQKGVNLGWPRRHCQNL